MVNRRGRMVQPLTGLGLALVLGLLPGCHRSRQSAAPTAPATTAPGASGERAAETGAVPFGSQQQNIKVPGENTKEQGREAAQQRLEATGGQTESSNEIARPEASTRQYQNAEAKQKAAYEQQAKARLALDDANVATLLNRINRLLPDEKTNLEPDVATLREKQTVAHTRLQQLQKNAPRGWETIEPGVTKAIVDLEASYQAVLREVNSSAQAH